MTRAPRTRAWRWVPCVFFCAFPVLTSAPDAPNPPRSPAKNIIVMIADGAGYNTFRATSMYQGRWSSLVGRSLGQPYDGREWTQLAKSTWSLAKAKPTVASEIDESRRYDSRRAWDGTWIGDGDRIEGYADNFAGYRWHKSTAPDSAATMTQMMTGIKTFDGAINVRSDGVPLSSIAEHAKRVGMSVGVVTTVQWSHATPAAAGGAHNVTREDYVAIANEMLDSPVLDLIFGAGHPEFSAGGSAQTPQSASDFLYVGGPKTWQLLKAGAHPGKWRLFEEKEDFESLAHSQRLAGGPPSGRILGVAKVRETLQLYREDAKSENPFTVPLRTTVPSLPTMALGALKHLASNVNGLFVMIEGGAIDWAMHDNNIERMIEEMIDFNRAVEAVVEWVETESSWEETLVIVTADHAHLLFGPDSDRFPFQAVVDRGVRKVPGHQWQSNHHSNQLVPFFARGVGAQQFVELADEHDPVRGAFIDDTEVATVLKQVLPDR